MPSKIKISKYIANLKEQMRKEVKNFNYGDFIKLKNKINKYYNKNKEEILEYEL